MARKKSKLTKLLDAYETAVTNKARMGGMEPSTWEQIDEDYFMARTRLQYYFEQMEKQLRGMTKQIRESLGSGALGGNPKT